MDEQITDILNEAEYNLSNIKNVDLGWNRIKTEIKVVYFILLPFILVISLILTVGKLPFNVYSDLKRITKIFLKGMKYLMESENGYKNK